MMVCLGVLLVAGVVVASGLVQARGEQRRSAVQRAAELQALAALRQATSEVLIEQSALVRVLGSLDAPIGRRWPSLANIVLSQPLATVAYFVEPVPQRALRAFERRTGVSVFDMSGPGAAPQPVAARRLHLVLRYGQKKGGPPAPVGFDLAGDPDRRAAMAETARTGEPVATPPVDFLVGRGRSHYGVVVYAAVRNSQGRLLGWVACDYATDELVSAMARLAPAAQLSIRDHHAILAGSSNAGRGLTETLQVGGRRWTARAYVPPGSISATPWLVLASGLALVGLVLVALAHSANRTRHALAMVAAREREDQAQLEAGRAREHAQTIIAAMAEGYALTVGDHLMDVNDALCEMTGFSRAELVGAAWPYPFWPSGASDNGVADSEQAPAADGALREATLLRRNGESFEAELTTGQARKAGGTMLGYVTTIRDVSERARHAREEAALRRLAQLVARGVPADEVFAAVAAQIVALFHAHSGMVTQFDPRAGVGRRIGGHGHDGRPLPPATYALDGASASALVFRTERAIRVDGSDPSHPDPDLAAMRAEGVCSAIAAPVIVSGRAWGTLAVGFSGCRIPPGSEEVLGRFAELVAMAIANAQTLQTLVRRATTDSLTGLANHHAFRERLLAEIQRARRHHHPLSLVLLDIDHFKAVNDAHGHPVGDRVLVEVARRLRDNARQDELVARLGGEEFAWLMPETDLHGAHHAAERLRRQMEATPFDGVGPVTMSAGVCSCPPDDAFDAAALVALADRALYLAKESGRNTTFVSSDDTHRPQGTVPGAGGTSRPSPPTVLS
jgi:diguanylate cyclase (GGDEF)-like protein/PAS domain S-box-containing protein